MLSERVSIPGPLTYESGAPPIALRGPAPIRKEENTNNYSTTSMARIPMGPYKYVRNKGSSSY